MAKKTILGRFYQTENGPVVVPLLSHKETVLDYQERVATLLEAARRYRDEQTYANVAKLADAAKELP